MSNEQKMNFVFLSTNRDVVSLHCVVGMSFDGFGRVAIPTWMQELLPKFEADSFIFAAKRIFATDGQTERWACLNQLKNSC